MAHIKVLQVKYLLNNVWSLFVRQLQIVILISTDKYFCYNYFMRVMHYQL